MHKQDCKRCQRVVYEEQETQCELCSAMMCLACEDDHECDEVIEL